MLMAIIRKKNVHTHTLNLKKIFRKMHMVARPQPLKNGLPVEIEGNFSIGADVQDV